MIVKNVTALGQDKFTVADDQSSTELSVSHVGGTTFKYGKDNSLETIELAEHGRSIFVFCEGRTFTFQKPDPLADQGGSEQGGDNVIVPMPGMVTLVTAKAGQSVSQGDNLIVLEAMKMEHALQAPRDGVIAEVMVEAGDQVLDGALLLSMVPEDE